MSGRSKQNKTVSKTLNLLESDPGSQGLLPLAPSFLLACDISLKTIELGSQEHQSHIDSTGVVVVAVAALDLVQNVKTADAIFSAFSLR